ncbi:GNAT family N-acetyltransferase [Maricaulis sp.]|uniref:GNAT family N-acetyltransferase n=1 Tax=Maricaulis sp. TaxID=1486257 RepID=UPI001B1DF06F|nr:GNAT family N-acetyltransferase [Maricaulis sp.]MBO6764515.1 GNAT family N-acetyltransferase [Maricaulis sp.]
MDTTDIRIRSLNEDDAARMCELNRQLGYEAGVPEMKQRMKQLATTGGHWLRGAQIADTLAGFIHFYQRPSIETGAGLVVQSLLVDAAIRGRGLGRILLGEAETMARELGLASVGLASRVEREDAHAFYIRQGYAVTATSRYFRKAIG